MNRRIDNESDNSKKAPTLKTFRAQYKENIEETTDVQCPESPVRNIQKSTCNYFKYYPQSDQRHSPEINEPIRTPPLCEVMNPNKYSETETSIIFDEFFRNEEILTQKFPNYLEPLESSKVLIETDSSGLDSSLNNSPPKKIMNLNRFGKEDIASNTTSVTSNESEESNERVVKIFKCKAPEYLKRSESPISFVKSYSPDLDRPLQTPPLSEVMNPKRYGSSDTLPMKDFIFEDYTQNLNISPKMSRLVRTPSPNKIQNQNSYYQNEQESFGEEITLQHSNKPDLEVTDEPLAAYFQPSSVSSSPKSYTATFNSVHEEREDTSISLGLISSVEPIQIQQYSILPDLPDLPNLEDELKLLSNIQQTDQQFSYSFDSSITDSSGLVDDDKSLEAISVASNSQFTSNTSSNPSSHRKSNPLKQRKNISTINQPSQSILTSETNVPLSNEELPSYIRIPKYSQLATSYLDPDEPYQRQNVTSSIVIDPIRTRSDTEEKDDSKDELSSQYAFEDAATSFKSCSICKSNKFVGFQRGAVKYLKIFLLN